MSFYEVASELENFHTLSWLGYLESLNHSDLIWAGKPYQIVGLISKNMTNATSKRVWLHCVAWICWTNEKKSNLQMNVHSNLFYFIYTWWVHTCSSLGLYSRLICIGNLFDGPASFSGLKLDSFYWIAQEPPGILKQNKNLFESSDVILHATLSWNSLQFGNQTYSTLNFSRLTLYKDGFV